MTGPVLVVLPDEHSMVCMTEELLDTWWENLSPERKAELFEQAHEEDTVNEPF